jgi:hypothetical protein
MNPNDEKEFYELIRSLSRGVKKHGVKKIISTLKQINIDNEGEVHFSIIEFIEKSVCSKIGVPREELFNFTSRGEITVARKFCILLIRAYIPNISDAELSSHYNRSRQVIHNTEKEFRTLKKGKQNKFVKDFFSLYNELYAEVSSFVESIKINTK